MNEIILEIKEEDLTEESMKEIKEAFYGFSASFKATCLSCVVVFCYGFIALFLFYLFSFDIGSYVFLGVSFFFSTIMFTMTIVTHLIIIKFGFSKKIIKKLIDQGIFL
jgi:hypothetical protein